MFYKKIISYIIAICLLLAISIPSLANNKEGNQISAMKNYEKLIDGFKKNFNEENPGIYGGSFIDEDGNLVINLVEGKDTKETKKVKNLFQVNEVKFRNVKYSINSPIDNIDNHPLSYLKVYSLP